jgi:hypothetical protein
MSKNKHKREQPIDLLALGVSTLISAYVVGTVVCTKELSDKIEPLRIEFEKKANFNHVDSTFNYIKYIQKLQEIAKVKDQYARDNGAFSKDWAIEATNVNKKFKLYEIKTKTPTPWALNPFKWSYHADNSAINNYFNPPKYRKHRR